MNEPIMRLSKIVAVNAPDFDYLDDAKKPGPAKVYKVLLDGGHVVSVTAGTAFVLAEHLAQANESDSAFFKRGR